MEDENVKKVFGIAVGAWFFVGFMIVVFSLLANYKNGLQFNGTVIFSLIWIFGIVILYITPRTRHSERIQGTSQLAEFWMENPDRHVIWILPAGFLGVLGASYLGSIINSPLAGIFGSGIVLLLALFYTRSILIPIIIHGSFNVFVILSQSGYLGNSFIPLAINPSFQFAVPVVGNSLPNVAPVITEILNQAFLVAPAEEVMKVVAIAWFIIFFKGYFNENTALKYLAGGASVLVWSFMHNIQSLGN